MMWEEEETGSPIFNFAHNSLFKLTYIYYHCVVCERVNRFVERIERMIHTLQVLSASIWIPWDRTIWAVRNTFVCFTLLIQRHIRLCWCILRAFFIVFAPYSCMLSYTYRLGNHLSVLLFDLQCVPLSAIFKPLNANSFRFLLIPSDIRNNRNNGMKLMEN